MNKRLITGIALTGSLLVLAAWPSGQIVSSISSFPKDNSKVEAVIDLSKATIQEAPVNLPEEPTSQPSAPSPDPIPNPIPAPPPNPSPETPPIGPSSTPDPGPIQVQVCMDSHGSTVCP